MMGSLGGIFSETHYAYDVQDRLIERTGSMFNLDLTSLLIDEPVASRRR